jgi:hypothetical protein
MKNICSLAIVNMLNRAMVRLYKMVGCRPFLVSRFYAFGVSWADARFKVLGTKVCLAS